MLLPGPRKLCPACDELNLSGGKYHARACPFVHENTPNDSNNFRAWSPINQARRS